MGFCRVKCREGNAHMTDKELRNLSRKDLLQLLLEQSREMEALQKRLDETEAALRDKTIRLDQAGSIAEAALSLSGIFEAAQAACAQYTDNISHLSQRQEAICARMEAESRAKADALLEQARQEAAALEQSTQTQCAQMLEKARAESQTYWETVSHRLTQFSAEHAELERLLSVISGKTGS